MGALLRSQVLEHVKDIFAGSSTSPFRSNYEVVVSSSFALRHGESVSTGERSDHSRVPLGLSPSLDSEGGTASMTMAETMLLSTCLRTEGRGTMATGK